MRGRRGIAIPALLAALLPSCHRPPATPPAPADPDARAVLAFLEAYGRRDLEGMMRLLAEDAVFRGSGQTLTKPQIRAYFLETFRRHPDLRVEPGEVRAVGGTFQVRVRVQTRAVWSDTWIFEVRNHRIRAYGLASAGHWVPLTS